MQNIYRKDIDGLRALAVVVVMLFHLQVFGFSGGYIGVDVFFVISGYLITSLIYRNIQERRFSLSGFYIRRIRRLAPALLITLAAISLLAFFKLKPLEMSSFASSLAFQSISMQNFFFLSEGDYFLGSKFKPLLHTWSLAVEEQFYFFWPLLLLFICRYSFKVQLLSLTVIMLVSFAVNLLFMGLSPKASFFLLPSRAWELGFGGLIAILETRDNFHKVLSHKIRTVLGAVGLALVCYSFFKFSASTPFPGWAALLPVSGTVFLLTSGIGSQTLVGRALSFRPLVLIGLISYPMYLWHWPIIVMVHHFGVSLTHLVVLAVFISTITLSAATYRFIELPIRSRKWFPTTKGLLSSATVGFTILTTFAVHTWLSDGASYRYSQVARSFLTAPLTARTFRCGIVFKALNPREQVCAMNENTSANRRVLLWGNSHADHWSELFTDLANKSGSAFYLNARNCRGTPDSEFCGKRIQKEILNFILIEQISDVVLSSTGYGSYGIDDEVYEENLRVLVSHLADNKVRTWLVIDVPGGVALNPIAAFESNPDAPRLGVITLSEYLKTKKREQDFFNSLIRTNSYVHVVDPSLSLCDSEYCFGGKDNVIWYKDNGHLTYAGAKVAMPQFIPIFFGGAFELAP